MENKAVCNFPFKVLQNLSLNALSKFKIGYYKISGLVSFLP